MKTIPLNEASVDAHFKLMTDPRKHGLPFRPLKECFEASETVTAQHVLFKDYLTEVPLAGKVFFYIVMWKVYGEPFQKDARGNLGYALRFVPKPTE